MQVVHLIAALSRLCCVLENFHMFIDTLVQNIYWFSNLYPFN